MNNCICCNYIVVAILFLYKLVCFLWQTRHYGDLSPEDSMVVILMSPGPLLNVKSLQKYGPRCMRRLGSQDIMQLFLTTEAMGFGRQLTLPRRGKAMALFAKTVPSELYSSSENDLLVGNLPWWKYRDAFYDSTKTLRRMGQDQSFLADLRIALINLDHAYADTVCSILQL